MAPHGVDLVDEDNAGSALAPFLEQVAHPARPHADEHLDKVRAADGEEGHVGLAGHGAGQQRLACAGRPDHQQPLGNLAAQLAKPLRVFQELDGLHQVFLGLLHPRYVGEGGPPALVVNAAGRALAQREKPVAPALHAAHEEDPNRDNEDERSPMQKYGQVPGTCLVRLHGNLDVVGLEGGDECRILGDVDQEQRAVQAVAFHMAAGYDHIHDLPVFHFLQEGAVEDLPRSAAPAGEHVHEDDRHHDDDQPDHEILVARIHASSHDLRCRIAGVEWVFGEAVQTEASALWSAEADHQTNPNPENFGFDSMISLPPDEVKCTRVAGDVSEARIR